MKSTSLMPTNRCFRAEKTVPFMSNWIANWPCLVFQFPSQRANRNLDFHGIGAAKRTRSQADIAQILPFDFAQVLRKRFRESGQEITRTAKGFLEIKSHFPFSRGFVSNQHTLLRRARRTTSCRQLAD